MAKNRHYLVLWMPVLKSECTVDKMKCIDAWSSTSGIASARLQANNHRYEYGRLYGNGRIQVVEQVAGTAQFIASGNMDDMEKGS